jgi:hypothetical protein
MKLDSQGWPVGWVCDGFKELRQALSLQESSKVTLLRVMGDAGGKKEKTNLSVGAYLGTVKQWDRRVKPLWIGELQNEAVECFHRTDMEIPGHREFAKESWTRERQVPLLNRLHKIIRDHTMDGQGHGLDAAAFQRLVPSQINHVYGGPYGIAVLQTVVYFGLAAKAHDDWIHYIFEAGDEGQGQINTVMAKLTGDERYREMFRIAEFTFGVKRGPCAIVQLQADDFMAFDAYKRFENYILKETYERKSFHDLLRPRQDFVMLWTEESIGAWLARVSRCNGNVIESMIVRE